MKTNKQQQIIGSQGVDDFVRDCRRAIADGWVIVSVHVSPSDGWVAMLERPKKRS